MRVLVAAALLSILLAPAASAQGSTCSPCMEPSTFQWRGHGIAFAHFRIVVPPMASNALVLRDVRVEPAPTGPVDIFWTPHPTLVVDPQRGGTFDVWVGGLGAAPPSTPATRDYTVRATVQGTLDASYQHDVTATIRQTLPPEPQDSLLHGRLLDSRTGQPPAGSTAATIHLANASSLEDLGPGGHRVSVDANGRFRISVPSGAYWIRAEAPGYRANFFGPLDLAPGSESEADLVLVPGSPAPIVTRPSATGQAGHATDRFSTSLGLERLATVPSSAGSTPSGAVSFFTGSAGRLWQRPIAVAQPAPQPSSPAPPVAVDVNPDGSLVAVGEPGGITVYDQDGGTHWSYRDDRVDNPKVPGPYGRGILRATQVRFSDDGEFLAAGTLTGFVYHFNVSTGARVWRFETAGDVRSLRYDPATTALYAAAGDGRLYAIDVATGAQRWSVALGLRPHEHLGMSQDGARIAVAGQHGPVRLVTSSGSTVWTRSPAGAVRGFDLDPSGSLTVVLTTNGLHAYDQTGLLRWFRHDPGSQSQVRFGPGGQFLGYGTRGVATDDPLARVVSLNGTLVWELRGPADTIRDVRILEDGARLVASAAGGTVYSFANWLDPRFAVGPPATSPSTTAAQGQGQPAPTLVLVLLAVAVGLGLRRRRA